MAQKNPFAEMMDMEAKQQANKSSDTVKENVGVKSDTKFDTKVDTTVHTKNDTKVDTKNMPHHSTNNDTKHLPTADDIDDAIFRYRKLPKVRANADIPVSWKHELDEYAHQQGVKKYHLVYYAVAKMLKKV